MSISRLIITSGLALSLMVGSPARAEASNIFFGIFNIFTTVLSAIDAIFNPNPPFPTVPIQGPGLGNLTYTNAEYFKTISRIDKSNGIPDRLISLSGFGSYGTNTSIMLNGYFVTLFAPDSGFATGGFLVFDVSNPRQIKLVKRIYEPIGVTAEFRESHSLATAKINGRTYIAIQSIKGIELWDFTDVNKISRAGKLSLPGVNGGDYTDVSWQLAWQAPYLYVAGADRGVYIVDTSDPTSPQLVNRGNGKPNPVPTGELGGFRVGPIFVLGNHMVLSSMEANSGLSSLDLSDPKNPLLLDAYNKQLPFFYATCFNGSKLYGAVRYGGSKMFGFDLTDPSKFLAEDNTLLINDMLYCATQDNYVFQGSQEEVHKVDVSNPNKFALIGSGNLGIPERPDHGQVSPMGNLLYIGNDHGTGSGFIPHSILPDTTPPSVVQISPKNGATFQAVHSRIGIAFSDSILQESVDANNIIVKPIGGQPIAGTFSVLLGIVNFAPAVPLQPETTYEVIVASQGVRDFAGNKTNAEFKSTFTTDSSLTVGLTHHWPLSNNTNDIVGRNHGLQNSNTVLSNGALTLNTTPLQLTNDIGLELGATSTVSFYIKTNQIGSRNPWESPGIFGKEIVGGTNDLFWGWIDDTGKLRLSTGNDTGVSSKLAINDGTWKHVIMTRDSGTGSLQMYVNGHLQGTAIGIKGKLSNRFNMLGKIDGNSNVFAGELASLRVHSRILTSTEITKLSNLASVSIPSTLLQSQHFINTSVQFSVNKIGAGTGYQYYWNFGDGERSELNTNSTVSHTYTAPGHYTVVLTVKRPDGSSTSMSFITTVAFPVTSVKPVATTNIVGTRNQVFSINSDSGTVSAINAQTHAKLWETYVGREPKTLAIAPNGRIWVAVHGDDKLVALTPLGTISSVLQLPYGSGPYGVVFTPNLQDGLISLSSKSQLLKFDPITGATKSTLNLSGDVRGIAVDSLSQNAYITRFRSTENGAQIHQVNVADMQLIKTLSLAVDTTSVDSEDKARGVPNYLNQIVISPDGKSALIPSKKDNIVRGLYRDGKKLDHDKTVRSILSKLDLTTGSELFAAQVDFNDRAPARALAYSPLGDYVFVAQMEGNMVEIVDAYNGSIRGSISIAGRAPDGIYIDASTNKLFTNNFLDRSVSVYDISKVIVSESFGSILIDTVKTVAVEPFNDSVLRGKKIFYNAADARMSKDNYLSCASCHADGDDDGMVWDFTERGEGLRNTISLVGRAGATKGRLHWSANFDEVQDFENDIRAFFGGAGFMTDESFTQTANPLGTAKKGKSQELDDLAAYLESLNEFQRSPARSASGNLTPLAESGKVLFGQLNCQSCHSNKSMQDNLQHDIGTIKVSSGLASGLPITGIDTPTLLGLWSTAPYFHDGQALTLLDVVNHGHGGMLMLDNNRKLALVEYLKSLDGDGKHTYFTLDSTKNYQLRSAKSGFCIGIDNNSYSLSAKAIQWTCDLNTENQKFAISHKGNGFYNIIAQHSRLCLKVQNGSTENGANVVQGTCGDLNQSDIWLPVSRTDGSIEWVAKLSGKALNANNCETSAAHGSTIVQTERSGANCMAFEMNPIINPQLNHTLKTSSGLCVDSINSISKAVLLNKCSGLTNQLFSFNWGEQGHYQVKSNLSGKCLNAALGLNKDRSQVIQEVCTTTSTKASVNQWRPVVKPNGYVDFVSHYTGSALDGESCNSNNLSPLLYQTTRSSDKHCYSFVHQVVQ